MTTIAVRDGLMCSDTQSTGGGYKALIDKMFRLPDGGIVGIAGGLREALAATQWMIEGEEGDPPDSDGSYTLLILRPNGSIWCADSGFPALRLRNKFAAIGSGCPMAMAAMEMGATAAQAVKIASKYDECTNSRVKSMALTRKRGL